MDRIDTVFGIITIIFLAYCLFGIVKGMWITIIKWPWLMPEFAFWFGITGFIITSLVWMFFDNRRPR